MDGYNFYIINLDRCEERWTEMKKCYKDTFIRVSAFDAHKLKEYDDIVFPNKIINLSQYELACSFSHLKAIKTAYENGDEEAFFIEDDILNTYKDYWKKCLREYVDSKPVDCECLTFFNCNPYLTDDMLKQKEVYLNHCLRHWSAGCYYITRTGMEKIYNLYIKNGKIDLSCLSDKLDIIADHRLIYTKLKTYNISEPTFIDMCKTSTIHPEHLIIHEKNNKRVKNYFKKNTEYSYDLKVDLYNKQIKH